VFDLAKQVEKKENENAGSASENENSDSEEEQKPSLTSIPVAESELFKSTEKKENKGDDRRDQGFVRPKVLILCPFKQMAYSVIEQIILMANEGKKKKVSKKKKFEEDFGDPADAFNDFFRIGLAVNFNKTTGKMALKLYEQFYQADIIVASPIALRMLVGHKIDDKANAVSDVD
jgi:hypothetical protein